MANEMSANPEILAQQVMEATDNLTDEEATQRYQMIMAQLPPDQAAELNKLALSQVSTKERRVLASGFKQEHQDPNSTFDGYHYASSEQAASTDSLNQMSLQAAQQDPGILDRILGNNSALGGKIGKAALAALAAILIRRLMSSQATGANQRSSGLSPDLIIALLGTLLGSNTGTYGGNDPLGGLLGGLLGGGSSSGSSSGGYTQQPSQTTPGGIDIGGLLGQILGGMSSGSSSGGYTQQPSQTPSGGSSSSGGYTQQPNQTPSGGTDLGGLLGGLLGGASSGGGVDLGSILGSILGGGSGSTTSTSTSTPAEPGAGSHVKKGVKITGE